MKWVCVIFNVCATMRRRRWCMNTTVANDVPLYFAFQAQRQEMCLAEWHRQQRESSGRKRNEWVNGWTNFRWKNKGCSRARLQHRRLKLLVREASWRAWRPSLECRWGGLCNGCSTPPGIVSCYPFLFFVYFFWRFSSFHNAPHNDGPCSAVREAHTKKKRTNF